MRLLNTTTLKLNEGKFASPKNPEDGTEIKVTARTKKLPEYAILSHRWAEDPKNEVTFTEINSGVQRNCEGWDKILQSCKIARSRGIEWIWIDTCCIDKSNSTELSEDINSMYRYYARAKECYAYLYDVARKQPPGSDGDRLLMENQSKPTPSEWFSRGWTLQELLAPGTPYKSNDGPPRLLTTIMIFFDKHWNEIGRKSDPALSAEISRHTSIPGQYLQRPGTHGNASIAMRMSWAAARETEKPEDRVYSLLGVFGVNMVLLYGEGETQAFMRLQMELMARSDDQSIFAWVKDKRHGAPAPCGMLATSLNDFADSTDVACFSIKDKEKPLYTMTKEGLEFRVFNGARMMTNVEGRSRNSKETIMLACTKSSGGRNVERRNVVTIQLERVGDSLQRTGAGDWKLSSKFDVPTSGFINPGLRRVFYIKQD